jgi:pyruvate-ferredoxin/flavodoxin oxidoreductase
MRVTIDGNEAAVDVAYRLNELCAIYPITPSSTMAELADEWASHGRANVWGTVPTVMEMQSEGGAAGAMHGALQGGALSTTFTASQGLLLMIPNMYKIAGELTSTVFHVAARSLAAQGLSIFGDHSDVMAVRQTGFALLASASVQEAHDMALVAQAATLRTRVPFVHFFDGFRTSHELNTVELIDDEVLRSVVPEALVREHRARALTPEHPFVRGTAQNPDVYFQARETVNPFYARTAAVVQDVMDEVAGHTGRAYRVVEYHGHPEAERVVVVMGSAAETVRETVAHLVAGGDRVGVLQVRLYRPFPSAELVEALPDSVRAVAVLDRTKEPGSNGEPLYLDVLATLAEAGSRGERDGIPRVIGGRYGLSSKELTPGMAAGVFAELALDAPRRRFTLGITDDVGGTSLPYDATLDIEDPQTLRAVFYGLGSDGTVGANKNTIKILGADPEVHAQAYFVYDSKKSGGLTVSHLRFGPHPIHAPYLVSRAGFVGCHHLGLLETVDVLACAQEGATLLLNAPQPPDEVWDAIPGPVQQGIIDKRLRLYAVDATSVARGAGLPGRTNTVLQTCFFAISGVLPADEAVARVKAAIRKTYGRRGAEVVRRNEAAVDATLAALHEVPVPAARTSLRDLPDVVPRDAPPFVRTVTAEMMAGRGDALPVSALPVDGTYPSGTSAYEKRRISDLVADWDPDTCIQCGTCSFVCPHSVIRSVFYDGDALDGAPEGFRSAPLNAAGLPGSRYTLQVYVEDCTGCGLCVESCPVSPLVVPGMPGAPERKAINLAPLEPVLEAERENIAFFETLPVNDRSRVDFGTVRGTQFLQPLFEFSGACTGCGETPYLKLLTQLFGDRLTVANATGCSSIYGGNLPTTPWTKNAAGRGPGLVELPVRGQRRVRARAASGRRPPHGAGPGAARPAEGSGRRRPGGRHPRGRSGARVRAHRAARAGRRAAAPPRGDDRAGRPRTCAAWPTTSCGAPCGSSAATAGRTTSAPAASTTCSPAGADVNVLVLDTEVYSNTGGQSSKATPIGAVAKFAAAGKSVAKKDLALQAIAYGTVYVARVAMGADPQQTLTALREAEAYDGPSLVIAYSHCIAHGIEMRQGLDQQYRAVASGHWPLVRYDPAVRASGGNPFQLDSPRPRLPLEDYVYHELRYRMLRNSDPAEAERLLRFAADTRRT